VHPYYLYGIVLLQRLGVIGIILILIYTLYQKKVAHIGNEIELSIVIPTIRSRALQISYKQRE
jgi:hypothetical protein